MCEMYPCVRAACTVCVSGSSLGMLLQQLHMACGSSAYSPFPGNAAMHRDAGRTRTPGQVKGVDVDNDTELF